MFLANRVGVLSTPGRQVCLRNPHEPPRSLSDQGLNIVVVFKIILIFIKKNVQFNTNYENMKKYKFETLFIKKSNLTWKYLFETWLMKNIKPHCHIDCYCAVFVPGCLGPLWTETLAQVASVGKTPGSDETPLGRSSKLLVDWVLGPMAGEMWVNRVAVVMIPVRPGTLTTAHVYPHTPTFGPRLSPQGIAAPPRGVSTTPNASTTEATWARV